MYRKDAKQPHPPTQYFEVESLLRADFNQEVLEAHVLLFVH